METFVSGGSLFSDNPRLGHADKQAKQHATHAPLEAGENVLLIKWLLSIYVGQRQRQGMVPPPQLTQHGLPSESRS